MTEKKKEHKKGKSELEVKNDQIKELTETVQRLQADFENYKKQVEKTRLNSCKFANLLNYTQCNIIKRLYIGYSSL